MAAAAQPGAEIGAVLVQVQEDLQQLKEKLRNVSHEWEQVDLQGLEAAIERTESGLRKHTEKYLSAINKSVLTISPSGEHLRPISKWGIPLETSQKEIVFPEEAAIATQRDELPVHISSGSKHKLSMTMRILCNPRNDRHRIFLNQNYGVSLPLINRRETAPAPTQKVAKGVTVGCLAVAPPPHGRTSRMPRTKIGAEKGILNLIERGLIPRAARITLEKSPVLLKPVHLHDAHTRHQKPAAGGGVASKKVEKRPLLYQKASSTPSFTSKGSIAPPPSCISVISPKKPKPEAKASVSSAGKQLVASPWLPKAPEVASAQPFRNVNLEFEIPVLQGVLDCESSSLLAFKQYCCLFWGSALSFLEHVANLLKDFAVPAAFIKGRKVMEILPDFELNQRPTREELLSVLKNYSAVKRLISQPGQRYKAQDGARAAAIKIQSTWRCYQWRRAYIRYRQQQWASGVIAISWLVHVHMGRVRKLLQESRQKHLENFIIRSKHLAANWNRIRTSRRTIIHIPSLGIALLSVDLSATSITHHIMTP